MSNEKFKVGDIVRVTKEGSHRFKIGDIVKLVAPKWRAERLDGEYWWVNESEIELIPKNQEPKILITTDGNTTTAKLIDGKKTVKIAEAKCSPNDKFDFMTGAKLAFERLTEEKKDEHYGFSVGDKVVVVNNGETYSLWYRNKVIKPKNWACGFSPYNGAETTVVGFEPSGDDFLILCETADNKVFLIGVDGISKKQPEPNQEPVKLYCVKSDKGIIDFKKGCIYSRVDNKVYDSDGGNCTFADDVWINKHFVCLVKRPAKVGEWVLVTKSDGDIVNTYKNGDVLKVVGINFFGNALYKHGREENPIHSTEYLVLDGYKGDEEEKRAAEIAQLELQKAEIEAKIKQLSEQ